MAVSIAISFCEVVTCQNGLNLIKGFRVYNALMFSLIEHSFETNLAGVDGVFK